MNRLLARIMGRRYNLESGHYDRTISVRELDFVTGVLEAHLLYSSEAGGVTFLRNYWFMYLGGTPAYPWILRRLEVGNPTAGAITFRMALMTVEDGSPGTANAFLAWDTPVAAGNAAVGGGGGADPDDLPAGSFEKAKVLRTCRVLKSRLVRLLLNNPSLVGEI